MLLDRGSERVQLDQLIDGARAGESGAVLLLGEAGIGKTALLEHAVESAADLIVLRAVGVESEMELAFAALHQLCAPILDRLDRLPAPQRDALAVTFGMREGPVPDRFLVSLAVLGLLSEAAGDRPLVCSVDDAQWLDRASAQALAFVARRLLAESVVMIFAAREPGEELRGLPQVLVEGLKDADAGELLVTVVPWSLDKRVHEQVVAETRGNPLALIELTQGLSPTQLAGGFGLPGALPLEGRIEQTFLGRAAALPPDTQRLLLLASAEPTGDPALLWLAGERLGLGAPARVPAETAGLIEFGPRVRFRHPLVRSAVYRAASLEERRLVHRALAETTDAWANPDRRAWHLAEATTGLDEGVAAELERSAERAQARGGLAAAAAFFERAVALTPDASRRADRALAAAQTKIQAGALEGVQDLLGAAEGGPLSELQQARAELVRAQLAYVTNRASGASALLLNAAKRLEPIAPELARATYLDAFMAANFAGRFVSPGGSLLDVARAAGAAPSRTPSALDLLVEGLAAKVSQGYAAGAPILRSALRSFGAGLSPDQEARAMVVAYTAALHIWDDEGSDVLSARWASLCRESRALSDLPIALNARAMVLLFAGDLTGVESLVKEVQAATEATGLDLGPYAAMGLAALRGHEAEVLALVDSSIRDASLRGSGSRLAAAGWANAVFNNGLGNYRQALAAAQRVCEDRWELAFPNWALPELIEAAARSGMSDTAADAQRRLAEMTGAAGTDWSLGIEARSRALLAEGDSAESDYREAIERLARTRVRLELARAHLLYGEWLRRDRRRVDAREQLRIAHEMFTTMGAGAFAGRAERELAATGERVRKRSVETRDDLTAQEAQIARLARDGLSNQEIGARLFISEHTVAYHLRKVFAKLSITSRNQLHRALPAEPSATAAA